MATTRRQARRDVALLLRDFVLITATADSGSASVLTDAVNVSGADNVWDGTQLLATAGTVANLGQAARVKGSSFTTGTLTLSSALPAPPVSGDEFEATNLSGLGFDQASYNQQIDFVVRASQRDFRVARPPLMAGTFARDPGMVLAPGGLTEVRRVDYQASDGAWVTIPRARRGGSYGQGWWAELADTSVSIRGEWGDVADGRPVRVWGYGPQPEVWNDDDEIVIDLDWFVHECAWRLAARRPSEREWSQWAVEWKRTADQRRVVIQTVYDPNTLPVRP